jgi:hypothetical protein
MSSPTAPGEGAPSTGSYAAFLLAFSGAVIAYWMLDFVFTSNPLSPVHQDDYAVLGADLRDLRFWMERPVSTNLAYLMGQGGPAVAFGVLNLLTAVVPALVLGFVFSLLQLRLTLPLAIAFGVAVFGHTAAYEHGKYLGLITNLTSHFFGTLSLVLLVSAWRRPRVGVAVAAVLSFALSVFAKEDFLLPPLLLLLFMGAEIWWPRSGSAADAGTAPGRRRWWLAVSACFALAALASVAFSWLVKNPFLGAGGSTAAPYAVNLTPASLLSSFQQLTLGYAYWQSIGGAAALLALFVFWRRRRREVLLLAAITFTLVLPYAVIPNRIIEYRVFAWLPWLVAPLVAMVAVVLASRPPAGIWRQALAMPALALFALPWLIAYEDQARREMVAGWYGSAQRMNENIIRTLVAQQAILNREPVVGIVGVQGLSPWSNTDGNYLQRKLGFANRWVVFVDKPGSFNAVRDADPSAYVRVSLRDKLCANQDMLLVHFTEDGTGSLVRSGPFCKGS